jgi:tRNA threonylcarbamoyl adenosine modification protein YeaZ
MKLALALEASSHTYGVALGAHDVPLIHRACRRDDPSFAGIGEMVLASLAEANAQFADIEFIGVDVGPGNLSSVRAAVAYANGLAYSLGIMLFCANSLELMAADSYEIEASPALCLTKAEGGNAYAGLFTDGQTVEIRYGLREVIVPEMAGNLGKLCVAGAYRELAADLLPNANVRDTGIEKPSVLALYRMSQLPNKDPRRVVPAASPLNEASNIFNV